MEKEICKTIGEPFGMSFAVGSLAGPDSGKTLLRSN
jgi:hypothetical protein